MNDGKAGNDAASAVDKSIRFRTRIYLAIFAAAAAIVIAQSIGIGAASIIPVLIAVAAGVLVGLVASRMYSLSWDTMNGKVVGRLDVIGGVILLGYVLISFFRTDLVRMWVESSIVEVASLAALAGVMAGQVIGTSRGIHRVLQLVGPTRSGPTPPDATSVQDV